MAKYNFKAVLEKKDEFQPHSSLTGIHQCEVYGCPRIATIKTGNWNCRYHHGRSGEVVNGVTLLLKNHEAEINWYEKVMKMPYHEYDILKGNAPASMQVQAGEDLIKYRVSTEKYIKDLLKHPLSVKSPLKTYISMTAEEDIF